MNLYRDCGGLLKGHLASSPMPRRKLHNCWRGMNFRTRARKQVCRALRTARDGPTACSTTTRRSPPPAQVWGNWDHMACRGQRVSHDKYMVSQGGKLVQTDSGQFASSVRLP